MKKKRLITSCFNYILLPLYFLLFIFLACSGCAPIIIGTKQKPAVKPMVESGDKWVVKSIEFIGSRSFKDNTLTKQLDFKAGDYLDTILAESGRISLFEFYRRKGFPDALITLDSSFLSQGRVIYKIDEGPRIQIKSIQFKGNSAIKTADLKKVIKIQTHEWFFWPNYYTEEQKAAAVERLRNIYYQRGFLNHNIRAEGQGRITFIIEEGPVYKIGQIIVTGNKFFDQANLDRLRAGIKLAPGQVYRKQSADAYAAAIRKIYRENGFVDADVKHLVVFTEPGKNIVNLEYNITESNQFRIGQIDISGNEETHDKVIRRILDEYGFTPGQLYNADIAPKEGGGKLQRDVQRMLMAEQLIITPVNPPDGAKDRKDVRLDITEGLTGMWSPGVAVGSDTGVIGRLMYEQRNFDITDWPDSLGEFITMKAFKGAGQIFRMSLEPGTEVSYYSVSFTEPYFRDKPTSLEVAGSSYERGRESYDEGRLRSRVEFEQRLKNRWRRSLAFRVENVDVSGVDSDAPKEIWDVEGDNFLTGVRFGVGRNMTDDIFTPSKGYRFDTSYEQVAGEQNFGILRGLYTWYRTLYEDLLGRRTVLAAKLHGATTVGEAPPFEKFYAGGSGTYGIRGFDYRGVSTRGMQTNVPAPERKDPIGSDWIFLAGAEVTMPLIGENFSALFFTDSGTIDTGGYRASIGAGIQILIPQWFGPVPMRFELATPFMKDDDDETQAFSFSIGGSFPF